MATPNPMIAIVDDDESVCRALKRLLHSFGMSANTFNSGQALLDLLSSATSPLPDCLIVDFEMQGIDGLELQRHLAPTGVPIIFHTATDDETVRKKALARGAAGYLIKPSDSAKLLTTVHLALGRPAEPRAD
jgi:FixJ family two-component response regulator